MKPVAYSVFTHSEHLYRFAVASQFEKVEEEDPLIRCHELARAALYYGTCTSGRMLSRALEATRNAYIEDGNYAGVDHSWVVLREWHDDSGLNRVILDPYAVGRCPMVQLVHASPRFLERLYYKADPEPRTDIRHDVIERICERIGLPVFERDPR